MPAKPLFRPAALPLAAASLLALAACASGGRPAPEPAAAPAAAAPGDPLAPPEAALRTAERVELTGTELGTMWTFENPPLDYWRETYGFQATDEWLEHVRLSSVRYGQHCSASFVSPEGLVMTNHHCARDCVEAVSTETQDYVVEGFYASTREEELVCPGLFLDQLVAIEDVTARIRQAVPAGAAATAAADAQEAESEAIEEACEAAGADMCQVVPLFHGGQFMLYTYRRYEPVKLVFAPELQAGFFGGDPDNFTYPRYALDVAFVRAYQEGGQRAAETPHHFAWDADGAREGELVFITGNPGSTSRQLTVAQVMYERAYHHPFIVQLRETQRDVLLAIAAMGPEAERRVREDLFSIENSLKAYRGQLAGLRDTVLLGRKILWERDFRQRIERDPELRARYGDVWNRIARIQEARLETAPRRDVTRVDFYGFASPHLHAAGLLAEYVRQTARPEAERDEDFRGEALERTEQMLRRPLGVDPEFSADLLARQLAMVRRWLPPGSPVIRAAFRPGETPEQAAARLVRETRVGDVAFRESIIAGGPSALAATGDPLLALAREMVTVHEQAAARLEELDAEEAAQEERLAGALFAAFGTDLPPDATFTLRISDGVVRRYEYNGTWAPPHTSYYGLYERATNFNNEMPWTLPDSFAERRDAIDMAVPLDFVTTNDITGGNSGSPMIDREARVVGVAFDSNIEGLPNEFLYSADEARAIGVHSAGILEALRSVYRTEALVRELLEAGAR